MIDALLLVFSIGALTRIADMIADDGLKLNRYMGYFIGILYGFLIAYVITRYPLLAELGIGVILAVVLTMKIDHPVHGAGIIAMLFPLFIYGMGPINIVILSAFFIGGAVDEIGDYFSGKRKIKGLLGSLFRLRLTMEAVTFAFSVYTGNWIFFLAMLAYDTGFTYIFPEHVRRKLIRLAG